MKPNDTFRTELTGLSIALLGAVIVVAMLAFAALALRFHSYAMDDSYITFRYASNLSSGHGLVFNPEEHPRSEGITSPLYAVLLSPATFAGIDMLLFSKFLGLTACLLAALLSGCVIHRLIRSVTELSSMESQIISACGGLWLLSNPYMVGNALSGMETALAGLAFAGFLCLILGQLASSEKVTRKNALLLGLSALLVPMFRPEMGLSVVLVFAVSAIASGDASRRFLLRAFIIFSILGTLYFFLRYSYYGLPFPLPFYIKQGVGGLPGRPDLESYLEHTFLLLPLIALAISFALRFGLAKKRSGSGFLVALSIAVAVQLGYYASILHIMGQGFRFFMPITIGLVVLAFAGVAILYDEAIRSQFSKRFSIPFLFACAGTLLVGANMYAYGYARDTFAVFASAHRRYIQIAHAISKSSEGSPLRIAINDCGVIPYYTGFPTLDLAGLNNRTLARVQTAEAARSEIVKDRPHLVMLLADRPHDTDTLFEWEQLTDSEITSLGYEYAGAINGEEEEPDPEEGGYYMLVYADTKRMGLIQPFLSRLAETGILELPSR